jgi:protein-S-isoprenylcysteine O-methyltransferase Ste14
VFFFGMITHRYLRDRKRMQEKYGEDFEAYAQRVPYVFIPGLF